MTHQVGIWVDADACPVPVKEILVRAANRARIHISFVANQFISLPRSQYLQSIQVAQGFDVADHEIARRLQPGDLVITADIPLAAEVIELGAQALSPRGELYSSENIRSRLNMRDFMESLRSSGVQTGGSAPYDQGDRQRFANQLDRWLAAR